MAFTLYTGWSEPRLLAKLDQAQEQLSSGRITELDIAGNKVRTDSGESASPELTIYRIRKELRRLYLRGATQNVYEDPGSEAGVTTQSFQ